MRKSDLVDGLFERVPSLETRRAASDAVDAALRLLVEGLIADGRVVCGGYGSLRVRRRSARRCAHPSTGGLLETPPSWTVSWTPSPALLAEVRAALGVPARCS